ncbi:TMEM175 family protein [Streptomyces sp. APSN-46.1]|uniref:TMEM175 family protein n=1 Tax=Streptomyces sp. APSN-46.1 TaxID=2929049 RepID=UPI001FB4D8B4|nr:TMEM175 family protein [Streptomyces sp. APSN-46.1]MCJ1680968.1 TMEM175 family protein [Streptomyces sp. APSN-46.1]
MEHETGRVEAFSDGVFAIIITILVLELKVPEETGSHFWHGVREQWPHYAAYVVSFLIIGVMWVNHHTIFSHLKRVDRPLLFLNLMVLMVVSVIPYTTNVLAEHLMQEGGSANAAAVLYSAVTVAYALAFLAFWWYVTRVGHLFHEKVDREGARATRVRFGLGAIAYPLTVVLAFFSAPLTLVAHFLIAIYYAANQIPIPLVVEEERLETASDLRK